jgi:GNAT superfamily N-acetyltransferase
MTDDSSRSIGSVHAAPGASSGGASSRARAILSVAPCGAGDLETVVDVIAGAFRDDPTWSWAFPDPSMRKRWWRFCIKNALRYASTFKTSGFEAVSVWIPPAGTEFSSEDEERMPGVLAALVGDRIDPVSELLRRFEAAHPREEPHWYLSLLGTHEAHRGRGLGMALLEENLARIDSDRMPAYLESSNPANDHRYEAVGFMPVVTFQAPGDGPSVTGMWRMRR